jgi:hypothetical protein
LSAHRKTARLEGRAAARARVFFNRRDAVRGVRWGGATSVTGAPVEFQHFYRGVYRDPLRCLPL